ncbi:MAG: hypothetical protein V5A43_04040 [Haloarculaceae archaeon]
MSTHTTTRANSTGKRSGVSLGSTTPAARGRQCQRDEADCSSWSGNPARRAGNAEIARPHRLLLETRVAVLEAELEHKQRELDVIRSQYERIIDAHGSAASEEDGDGFLRSLLR